MDEDEFDNIIGENYEYVLPIDGSGGGISEEQVAAIAYELWQEDQEKKMKDSMNRRTIDGIVVLVLFVATIWLFTGSVLDGWGWSESRVVLACVLTAVLFSFSTKISDGK